MPLPLALTFDSGSGMKTAEGILRRSGAIFLSFLYVVFVLIALPGVSVRPGASKGLTERVVLEEPHARFSGGSGGSKRAEA
ncbi:MAG: hypothetical protein ACI8RZ_004596 [Myxococcota bacterium]|jgi:hypothetical protein